MSLKLKLYEDDEGYEVEVPAKYEVCPRCEGKGTHVNPSIDGNGLSSEDFDQDPDFREDYMSGVYDVACHECDGKRVILVADEQLMTAEQKVQWQQWCESEWARAEEDRQQARWGW